MDGPKKPNKRNDQNQNGGNDNKKRPALSFLSIVLWAVLLVLLLNTCSGSLRSASTQEVEYSQFKAWVSAGYVDQVDMESSAYYFTVKTGTPPLTEYAEQLEQQLGNKTLFQTLTGGKGSLDGAAITFVTAPPPVTDTDLITLMDEKGVNYGAELVTQQQYLLSAVVSYVVPTLITVLGLVLVYRWMFKKMGSGGGFGGLGGVGKSNAKVYMEKSTGVTFRDVAGQDEAKESLTEIIDFLHNPQKYTDIGAKLPKGALLVGPPGTGKTLLAKAVAGEANVPFFSISGSDFVEMFVGVGASRVRDLFKEAAKVAPCIVFIDEIDTIGKSRDNRMGGNDEREQTLNQLLAEMDGFDPTKGVILLAATNRPEVLDKALLRPGRFDRRITIDRPNLAGRIATLEVHTRNIRLSEDVNLKKVALATAGCVGADLANLVNEAALRAVRLGRKAVNQADLLAAFELVIAGTEKKGSVLTEFEKKLVAYHEVGHAMVAYKQKNTEPVQKITIVPHTQGSLGYTLLMPEEDKTELRTREELTAKITVSMGGRAAEEVVMNTMTNGASQDIQDATQVARNMVAMYGMSDEFGMMALASRRSQYLDGGYGMDCAQDTAAAMDSAVREILNNCYKQAVEIIRENREDMDKVVAYLLEKETITGAEMVAIIEGRDPALVEDEYASTRTRSPEIEAPAKHIRMISEKIEPPAPADGGAGEKADAGNGSAAPDTAGESTSPAAAPANQNASPENGTANGPAQTSPADAGDGDAQTPPEQKS